MQLKKEITRFQLSHSSSQYSRCFIFKVKNSYRRSLQQLTYFNSIAKSRATPRLVLDSQRTTAIYTFQPAQVMWVIFSIREINSSNIDTIFNYWCNKNLINHFFLFLLPRERISWAGSTSRGLRSEEPEQVASVSWWEKTARRRKAWPIQAPLHYFYLHHQVRYEGLQHGW